MLRISFKLGDGDLRHFEQIAQQTQAVARTLSPQTIVEAAREILQQAERAQAADFVKERFSRLRVMLEMVSDADWTLAAEDRQRILNALAYFSTPASGDPKLDATVGFLDHAIMIELVSRDLEHDLAAYRDFCTFRAALESRSERARGDRAEQLRQRCKALQTRMHARRARALDRAGGSVRKLFALFGL